MSHGESTIIAQFVHPGLAWAGLGLATVPVIIHLLNRRRYRKMDWAAMEFLLAAHKRSVRRLRLEQFLLLFLRCLIILLLGLGLARPFASPGAVAGLGQARRHQVLLIDNSLSTSAPGRESAQVFQEIKRRALELLDSFPSGDTVTVIPLAKPAAVALEGGSYDRQLAREQIEAIRPTYRGTDLPGGLRLARQSLQRSEIPASNHAVTLLTDNVRAAWLGPAGGDSPAEASSAGRLAAELARQASLTIVQASPGQRDNLTIEEFAPELQLVGTLLPTPLGLRVVNHSARPTTGAGLQILLNGRIVRELEVPPLGPQEEGALQFRLQFEEPGEQNLLAVLSGGAADALAADSRHYLTVEATPTARVLLVDGKPAARRFESQCGYLATALAPEAKRRAPRQIEPKVITDAELETEVFGEYGVIILCNVRRLAQTTCDRLAEFVAGGGALVAFLGDNVLVDHYNRAGFAQGRGALAAAIGRRALPAEQPDAPFVLFGRENLTHPVMADFADHATGSLFVARTRQYYKLAEVPAGAQDQAPLRTVLKFENGDPAIVERLLGRGTSLLVTTTANMEWTNLPAKGDFVSLMWNLVGYAWPGSEMGRNLVVGWPVRRRLTPAQFSLANEFVLPDGTRVPAEIVALGDGFAAQLQGADQPGFYKHEAAGAGATLACNVDLAESDLQPINEAALGELIGGAFELYVDRLPRKRLGAGPGQRELSWHLLYLAFVLLLLEPLLAMWFGKHR